MNPACRLFVGPCVLVTAVLSTLLLGAAEPASPTVKEVNYARPFEPQTRIQDANTPDPRAKSNHAVDASGGKLETDVGVERQEVRVFAPGNEPYAQWFRPWTFWRDLGFDQSSLIADPQFIDAQRHDYRLQPTSPVFKLGFEPIDLSTVGPRQRGAM